MSFSSPNSTTPAKEHDSINQVYFEFTAKQYCTVLILIITFGLLIVTRRERGHASCSFRAAPRCPTCCDRFRLYAEQRASLLHRITPLVSARRLLFTLIFFSLERSAAAKVRILKRMRSRNCTNRFYYKYHTRIAHRSQRKISTR